MPRKFLNEYGERERVNDVFVLGEKQLRQNRNGNLYLQMRLADKSGSCNAMMWDADEKEGKQFRNGDYVSVEGLSQFYNGSMQIIVNSIELAEPGSVNEEDFVHVDRDQIEKLVGQAKELLNAMQNEHLVRLANSFLEDEPFMRKFTMAPAAIKNHHAYRGGLLDHVVQLMRLARKVAEDYDEIDDDLLVMGAFLHDVGKIDELTYQRDLGYSDEGQLIGHLVMGVSILERQIEKVSAPIDNYVFPYELALRLKHMIVSHHGRLEFGSPKVPMTLEAVALSYIDDLDAKIRNFKQLMDDDANDGPWTTYHPNLERKLFKGSE